MKIFRNIGTLKWMFALVFLFQLLSSTNAQPPGNGNGHGNGPVNRPCSQPPCGGPNQVPIDARLLFVLGAALGAYLLKVRAEKR
jgi:hypothetical protein